MLMTPYDHEGHHRELQQIEIPCKSRPVCEKAAEKLILRKDFQRMWLVDPDGEKVKDSEMYAA